MRRTGPAPELGILIAGWASGKVVKIKGDEGEWHELTPDNIHGMTEEKEWVTLREAIARYDHRHMENNECSHKHCEWIKDEERYDCER